MLCSWFFLLKVERDAMGPWWEEWSTLYLPQRECCPSMKYKGCEWSRFFPSHILIWSDPSSYLENVNPLCVAVSNNGHQGAITAQLNPLDLIHILPITGCLPKYSKVNCWSCIQISCQWRCVQYHLFLRCSVTQFSPPLVTFYPCHFQNTGSGLKLS